MDGSPGEIKPAPPTPKTKTFSCPGCGASLTIRGLGQTESLACDNCGAIVDITDENFRILETYRSKIKYQPSIPLGTRGSLRGEIFEVIGYMRRKITVEGLDYAWSEYLLFNPYRGFRWLSEYNGHWNYIKTTTNIPKLTTGSPRASANYLGESFAHFQTAEAQVTYVLGEFYWRVQVEESCTAEDYISPPRILSREITDKEIIWSIGEYIEPVTIWEAFSLKKPVPPKIGIAPNQPSPFMARTSQLLQLLTCFLLAALGIQIVSLVLSQNKLVYRNSFTFNKADKEQVQVTEDFELTGRPTSVAIRTQANVDNGWLYLGMALINQDSGHAYDFGREISYYHGYDGGEAWSEGSRSDKAILPTVPAGRYYLRIEPDSEASSVFYSIQVYRDVPNWTFLLIALGSLSVIPLFYMLRRRSFEYKRWMESDHPMKSVSSIASNSDDDE